MNVYIQHDFADEMNSCNPTNESEYSVRSILKSAMETWNQESRADALIYRGEISKDGICNQNIEKPALIIKFDPSCQTYKHIYADKCRIGTVGLFEDAPLAAGCDGISTVTIFGVTALQDLIDKVDCNQSDKTSQYNYRLNSYSGMIEKLQVLNTYESTNLRSVFIHEIGHALGIEHSYGIDESVMQEYTTNLLHLSEYEQGCSEYSDVHFEQSSVGRQVLTEHAQWSPHWSWQGPYRTTQYDHYSWTYSNLWLNSGLPFSEQMNGFGYVLGRSTWSGGHSLWWSTETNPQKDPVLFSNLELAKIAPSGHIFSNPNTRPLITTLEERMITSGDDDHRIYFHEHMKNSLEVPQILFKKSINMFADYSKATEDIHSIQNCIDEACVSTLHSHLPLEVAFDHSLLKTVFARVRTSMSENIEADSFLSPAEHKYQSGYIDIFINSDDGDEIIYAGSIRGVPFSEIKGDEWWKAKQPRTNAPVGIACMDTWDKQDYPCMIAWVNSYEAPYDRVEYTYFRIDVDPKGKPILSQYPNRWIRADVRTVAGVDLAFFSNTYWMTAKSSQEPYGAIVAQKTVNPFHDYAWDKNSPVVLLTEYPIVDAPNFHAHMLGGDKQMMPLITWTVPIAQPGRSDCDGVCWND